MYGRAKAGIPPVPLSAADTSEVCVLLQQPNHEDREFLKDLLVHRVPPGVDDASRVKATFLRNVLIGAEKAPEFEKKEALEVLGTMLGGYNVQPIVDQLDEPR